MIFDYLQLRSGLSFFNCTVMIYSSLCFSVFKKECGMLPKQDWLILTPHDSCWNHKVQVRTAFGFRSYTRTARYNV